MKLLAASCLLSLTVAGCTAQAPERTGGETTAPGASASDASAHQAHDAYVTAINSNDLDTVLGVLTDDVVYLSAHEAPMVGKAAVRPWLEGYLKTYRTHWDKPVKEFIVNGAWAFERYSYTSTDTPIAGGDAVTDTGWGLVIYHRDADGKWRVARDAWGPDHPAK
jgi:ketosteroid isomerase-like protein